GEPFQAFAGAVEPVHQRAIEYGDREIWGAEVGAPMDITLASHGAGPIPASGFDSETLRRACMVTKHDGVVIMPTTAPVPPPAAACRAGGRDGGCCVPSPPRLRAVGGAAAPPPFQRVEAPPGAPRRAALPPRDPVAHQDDPRRVLPPPLAHGRRPAPRPLHPG